MAKRRKKILTKKKIREFENKYAKVLLYLESILIVIGAFDNNMPAFMQSLPFKIAYNLLFIALLVFNIIIFEGKPTTSVLVYLGVFSINLWLMLFPSLDKLSLFLNIILTVAPIVYILMLLVKKSQSYKKNAFLSSSMIWITAAIQLFLKAVNLAESYEADTTPFLIPTLYVAIAIALGTAIFFIIKKNITFFNLIVWPLIVGIMIGVLFLLILSALNYSLDLSTPEEYSGTVISTDFDIGIRRSPTTYEITVLSGDDEIDLGVTKAQYYEYYVGQNVTIYRYEGALGAPYYIIE